MLATVILPHPANTPHTLASIPTLFTHILLKKDVRGT